jgi:hypothetical protein
MTHPLCLFLSLAQGVVESPGQDAGQAAWPLVVLFIVVIAIFMVAGVVIYIVRSRAVKEETTQADIPLTLSEIRRMRRDGEIDDGEMERLKGIVLAQTRRDLGTPPEPKKEEPKIEVPKTEEPKEDSPKTEEPKEDASNTPDPTKEEPKKE